MGELEQSALRDGFRVALLVTDTGRASISCVVNLKIFDGGRIVDGTNCVVQDWSPAIVAQLSRLLYRVIQPPHLLVVYGRDSYRLIREILGDRMVLFRIFDLRSTAVALHPSLPAQASGEAILRAYAVPHLEHESPPASDAIENLLWAVIAEADRRGFSWNALLQVAATSRYHADFSRCAFDATMLTTLPEQPGVYAMYDQHNRLLYVGKSANIRRRMSDYFSAAVRLSDKLQHIRRDIRDISFHVVGSELEALLLENHLIQTQHPATNIQRHVAEGRSRYAEPFLPILLVTRSAHPKKVDTFLFAAQRHAYQMTVAPQEHRAPRSLMRLIAHFLDNAPPPKPNKALRDWGSIGSEICRRYFGRHRPQLHWTELTDIFRTPQGWVMLQKMAEAVWDDDAAPAEFRDG